MGQKKKMHKYIAMHQLKGASSSWYWLLFEKPNKAHHYFIVLTKNTLINSFCYDTRDVNFYGAMDFLKQIPVEQKNMAK